MASENRIINTIAQLGELRELLLVIDQSGEVVPAILLKLARDKAQEIFGSIDALRSPEYWEELNRLVLSEWDEEIEPVEEPAFEDEAISEEEEPTFEAEDVAPEEELVVEEPAPESLPIKEEETISELFDVIPEEEENDFWDDDEEDFYDDEEEELLGEEEPDVEEIETEGIPEVLTLDEALQRKRIQELRKALSLNDKFRFRRELFGNSDVRMNETLALIDAMESYDEAEDYLYGDLGWDAENPEVAEFMKIVQNRFL